MALSRWVEWLPADELSGALAAAAFREMAVSPEWDPAYEVCLDAIAAEGRVSELREARDYVAAISVPAGPDGAADAVLAAVISRLASGIPEAAGAVTLLAQPLVRARRVREILNEAGEQAQQAALEALDSHTGQIEQLL